jgi:hypothetical protein
MDETYYADKLLSEIEGYRHHNVDWRAFRISPALRIVRMRMAL